MTSAGNAARLYTPEILGLAVELANYPMTDVQTARAEVRSRSCGSTLMLAIKPFADRTLREFGLRVSACAIGQAAAAIFARSAKGMALPELNSALVSIEEWLEKGGPAPDWPGLEALAAARNYPARHGAILLPWRAAIAALSKGDMRG